MEPNESTPITPAQKNLLSLVSREDARTLYDSISATLALAMLTGQPGAGPFVPTPATLENWYFTLKLLDHLHAIAAERPD